MTETIQTLTDANWEDTVRNADKPLLIDCWAPWCAPCRALLPSVIELAADYADDAVVAKLNIDENPAAAEALGIRSIPTLILFNGGKERERVLGATSKTRLAALLETQL